MSPRVLLVLALAACGDKSNRLHAFDDDGDGYYTELSSLHGGEPPWDCDDAHAEAHPGGTEACDGLDNDCNGTADDGDDRVTVYADADGDTFGDAATATLACGPGDAQTTDDQDCDDGNDTVHPGGVEVCNGKDDDCNGTDDDGASDAVTWWLDGDDDGAGDDAIAVTACDAPEGYVPTGDVDCDDDDDTSYPGAAEVCGDGADNDCSGDAAGCEWPAALTLADADVVLVGASDDVAFGTSLAVGDVTGDGIADLAVGTKATGGRVKLWTGGATFAGGDPQRTFTGVGDAADPSSLAIGDVSGDSAPDLVVGWSPVTPTARPTVTVYAGPTLTTTPTATLTANGHENEPLQVVVGQLVGDDTVGDLVSLIGTHVTLDAGPITSGPLAAADGPPYSYVALGVIDLGLTEGPELWTSQGTSGADIYGAPLSNTAFPVLQLGGAANDKNLQLASADCDLDGHPELLYVNDTGGSGRGEVDVFDGAVLTGGSHMANASDHQIAGTDTDRRLRRAFGIGDSDNDGTDDVAVSTNGAADGSSFVWIVSGSALTTATLGSAGTTKITLEGGSATHPAYAIAAGDINGDGTNDLIVGAPDTGAQGEVIVFLAPGP